MVVLTEVVFQGVETMILVTPTREDPLVEPIIWKSVIESSVRFGKVSTLS